MRSIMKERHNLKVKKQLYMVYLISIFLPMMVIGIYLIMSSYNLLLNHHKNMLVSDNIRVRSIIFEVTTSLVNICEDVVNDVQLQELLSVGNIKKSEAEKLLNDYTNIGDYYGRHTEVSTITLYINNTELGENGYIKQVDETILKSDWYNEAIALLGYNWTWIETENKRQGLVRELGLTYKIPIHGTDEFAILVITASNNYLKNRIDNNTLEVDIAVDKMPIFYSDGGNAERMIDHSIDYDLAYYSYSGMSQYFGEKELTEISTFKPVKGENRIYIVSIDSEANEDLRHILLITTSVLVIGITVPLWVIFDFTKAFSERIIILKREMKRVAEGDFDIIDTFKGNDELSDLFESIKVMITSIKGRDEEIYEAKISEQKLINHQQQMEFEILSSKMNPHFLYNTLETIRMMAFNMDNKVVANAVKLLGKYMRYNMENSGDFTNLKTELEYIRIYLEIQKLRFGSKINYTIEIVNKIKLEKYAILPLLIQPIVENAIIHGLEETIDDGKIQIHIFLNRKSLIISVKDNGSGMDEDQLEGLKDYIYKRTKGTTNSIGLQNTHQRIQLRFGNAYGLRLFSELGYGTHVQIVLPEEVGEVE